MEAMPLVLNINISRADYFKVAGKSGGVRTERNKDKLDLPIAMRLTLGESRQTFVLRAVILNVGTETTSSGHYGTARLEGSTVFFCNGADVATLVVRGPYFKTTDFDVCKEFLPTKACYSQLRDTEDPPHDPLAGLQPDCGTGTLNSTRSRWGGAATSENRNN